MLIIARRQPEKKGAPVKKPQNLGNRVKAPVMLFLQAASARLGRLQEIINTNFVVFMRLKTA